MGANQFAGQATIPINRQLYHRFSKLNLPRHTSYPAVPFWSGIEDDSVYSNKLRDISQLGSPTSFYLHVPFCEELCRYCGCNKLVVSRKHTDARTFAQRYIDGIQQEMAWINQSSGGKPWNVQQIHWGGGTPTWLKPKDIETVWRVISRNMKIAADAELSIEIDPRVTSFEQLYLLRDLGFNRVSLGVQDFDPAVQKAIQRHQPAEMVWRFVEECRHVGFSSVNFDLIYGLPMQTRESMEQTLSLVTQMAPDRIAFYRLALLPEIFKWQRTFNESDIPADDLILDFMLRAMDVFGASGWTFIGLDHFAKETDELSQAMKDGTLRRSFQGMTTGAALPVIGLGPSAISSFDDLFVQNESQFPAWTRKVEASGFATVKGHRLTTDDVIRHWVIGQLYCYRRVSKKDFARNFAIGFDDYFSRSRLAWKDLSELDLIEESPQEFRVRPVTGWLLLRVIAATFDSYLPSDSWRTGVQSTIASRVG